MNMIMSSVFENDGKLEIYQVSLDSIDPRTVGKIIAKSVKDGTMSGPIARSYLQNCVTPFDGEEELVRMDLDGYVLSGSGCVKDVMIEATLIFQPERFKSNLKMQTFIYYFATGGGTYISKMSAQSADEADRLWKSQYSEKIPKIPEKYLLKICKQLDTSSLFLPVSGLKYVDSLSTTDGSVALRIRTD